jgi:type IV secretory pathway TrbD component
VTTQIKTAPIYRSLNKPLTILGTDRKLFFLAAVIGAATFNFFGSLLGGLLMFALLFVGGRIATAKDPQFLQILFNSTDLKPRYDSAKQEPALTENSQ